MLRTLGSLLTLVLLASPALGERPNIILVFSDDHAYQAISSYGDERKLLETPHIDRLAKEGVRFNRCLVPNSICGPSRATVLTGKYSHLNGFYNNTNSRFDGSQVTFPKLLQKAGYQTAIIGKWHLVTDPTGFDSWHILPGQGVYYNPPMIDNGKRVKHEGYTTDLISKFSIDWIKNRDKKKPFLLMTQHKAPHREWSPALRHLGHDKDRKYPEPPTLFDDYANRGLAVRDQDMTLANTFTASDAKLVPPPSLNAEQRKEWDAYYDPRNEKFRAAKLEGKELIRWRYNRYMHDYLGCIKAVDEAVGDLLKCLEDEGLAKNTLVVYCSDQGFFLGEHGWFDKRWILEESLKTPLLVRWPGVAKAGHVDNNLTSIVDLAQTFLDAAGVPADKDMQGSSLVPLLKGERPKDWRKSFYYEYFEYPSPHRVMPHYGVVTDRYKLARFYVPTLEGKNKVDYWELYDREKDPLELKDFANDPAYADTVKELKAEIERLRKDLKVPERIPNEAFGTLLRPGKKGPPPKPVKPGLGWRFAFTGKEALRPVKATFEKGELVLPGDGHVAVTGSLQNPAGQALSVGARVWLDGADGVLVAHGGESHGFALYIEKNEPVFAVRSDGKLTVARAGKKLARGRWFHVLGELDADGKMRVWIDAKEGPLVQGGLITTNPADGLSLGADTGSWVGEYRSNNPLTGRLRDVRLYWGAVPEKALQQWAGLPE